MRHEQPKRRDVDVHTHKPVLNILVVDDEVGFRNLLKYEFDRPGIQVHTAKNGAEGVEMARNTKFDVIITDVTMPEMDGLKFLVEMKKTHPHIEIIVATGFGAVETAVYAMKKGAFDFVLKPYDLE